MVKLLFFIALIFLTSTVLAQDVTITKGTNGEIVITGGKRTPPPKESSAEADARRAAQVRSFDAGAAKIIRREEEQQRASSARAVRESEAQAAERERQRNRDQEEMTRLNDTATYHEKRANKASSAYWHEWHKDEQRDAQEKADKFRRKLNQP